MSSSVSSDLRGLPERLLARLGVEPEWTVADEWGVGFVVGELGTWLSVTGTSDHDAVLNIETRLAVDVPDGVDTSEFCDARNHKALVGRWVYDPASRAVSLVASLRLGRQMWSESSAAEVVAEMVAAAEWLVFMSAPQKVLHATKALTLVRGRRRVGEDGEDDEADEGELPENASADDAPWHPLLGHLNAVVYRDGDSDRAAALVLPLVQDELVPRMLGWYVEHDDAESWCERSDGLRLLVRVARHPHAGWGVMLALSGEPWQCTYSDGLRYLPGLNRAEVDRPGDRLGCWTHNGAAIEYRVFVTNALLACMGGDLDAAARVLDLAQDVAARADATLLDRDPPTSQAPVLIRAEWPDDEQAKLLARRDPINDGVDNDALDLSIFLDTLGRACGITDESYTLWRSRLCDGDEDDPQVAGFIAFAEVRIADRLARRERAGK